MFKRRFPYDANRAFEFEGNREAITPKQIWYIQKLSDEQRDRGALLNDIMDSIDSKLDIEDLNKGQASFVIKCLLGEIKPIRKLPLDTGRVSGV